MQLPPKVTERAYERLAEIGATLASSDVNTDALHAPSAVDTGTPLNRYLANSL